MVAAGDVTNISDIQYLLAPPTVRLVAQAVQSIAHNAAVALQFGSGSEVLDTNNWHDTVTNNSRITPNLEGWYEARGGVALGGRTDYITQYAWIRTSGTTSIAPATKPALSATQINSTDMITVVPVFVYCNGTTDYVELMTQHTNGAAAAQNTALSFQFSSVLELKLAFRP